MVNAPPAFNQIRAEQVHMLANVYKDAVTLSNAPEQQVFRVPLILS